MHTDGTMCTLADARNLGASRLGFGCTQLMGLGSEQERLRILGEVYDAGITHLDVARAYGVGLAEAQVGRFARGKRDKITITTKFGILPPSLATAAVERALGLIGRRIGPVKQALIRRSADRHHRFTLAEAKKSIEKSLAELNCDYVDILLLHEATADEAQSDEIATFLETCVKEGKIRAYGTSATITDILAIIRSAPRMAAVVQFENSVFSPGLSRLGDTNGRLVITHRALQQRFAALHKRISDDSALRAKLSQQWRFDAGDRSTLGRHLLASALLENPNGIVLFSSRSAENIRANGQLVNGGLPEAESIEAFRRDVTALAADLEKA